MDLQKRLDEAIRTLDLVTKESVHKGGYNFEAADLRELLIELRALWEPPIMYMGVPIEFDQRPGHIVFHHE